MAARNVIFCAALALSILVTLPVFFVVDLMLSASQFESHRFDEGARIVRSMAEK